MGEFSRVVLDSCSTGRSSTGRRFLATAAKRVFGVNGWNSFSCNGVNTHRNESDGV